MGFFSKLCAVSNLPVMAAMAGVPELTKVVAFLPDGTAIRGTYDGYGRVDGVDLNASGQFNDAKFVLLQFINEGMTYGNLPPSANDPGQGYFHDSQQLQEWLKAGGFPNPKAMEAAFWRD